MSLSYDGAELVFFLFRIVGKRANAHVCIVHTIYTLQWDFLVELQYRDSCQGLSKHEDTLDGKEDHLVKNISIIRFLHLFPKGSGFHALPKPISLLRRQPLTHPLVERHTNHPSNAG